MTASATRELVLTTQCGHRPGWIDRPDAVIGTRRPLHRVLGIGRRREGTGSPLPTEGRASVHGRQDPRSCGPFANWLRSHPPPGKKNPRRRGLGESAVRRRRPHPHRENVLRSGIPSASIKHYAGLFPPDLHLVAAMSCTWWQAGLSAGVTPLAAPLALHHRSKLRTA